jgi:hypothetical protein
MRALCIAAAVLALSSVRAQLVNGSFEDMMGNYSDSGWVSTCSPIFGPAAPGWGNNGILVPHSNAPGCGWSRLYQLVPAIADGETWTLSGWCCNFTYFWADPYIGFRFGIKHGDGSLSFNTAALMNFGAWDHLQVTNTFSLLPDDTVFVECDPGTVSGMGTNQVFANFDGVELTSPATGAHDATSATLPVHPNPAMDRLWVACEEVPLEVRVIGLGDGSSRTVPVIDRSGTMRIDVSGLSAGAYAIWVRVPNGVRTSRFVKR